MPATIEQITQFCLAEKLSFQIIYDQATMQLVLPTEAYRDTRGNEQVMVLVQLPENGSIVHLAAPNLYAYYRHPRQKSVFQACLVATARSSLVQYEYEPATGEIRAAADILLEDALLTARQFFRALDLLLGTIETYDGMIRSAAEHGRVVMPKQLKYLGLPFLRNNPACSHGGEQAPALPEIQGQAETDIFEEAYRDYETQPVTNPLTAAEAPLPPATDIYAYPGIENLSIAAPAFPVENREEELHNLAAVLMRLSYPNPLLVGDRGVGKTSLVEKLAAYLRTEDAPAQLKECALLRITARSLCAPGAVNGLVQLACDRPEVILVIEDLHHLYYTSDFVQNLLDALDRRQTRVIGICETDGFRMELETRGDFLQRFQIIRIEEPDQELTARIVRRLAENLVSHYGIQIPEPILERAIDMAGKHLVDRKFPLKVCDLLDIACSIASVSKERSLTPGMLKVAVEKLTGLSVSETPDHFLQRLGRLEETLGSSVLGQDNAIHTVANTVRICKRRLDLRPERPDGVFLFIGPSGVGKTALARALNNCLTGTSDSLVAIDMSEFAEPHTVSKFLGAPAGYLGYGEIPLYLQRLQSLSHGVLLLDEFEKAHPDIHKLFLQVFDSGRMTDSAGRHYDLSRITIIATANIYERPQGKMGFREEDTNPAPGAERLPWQQLHAAFPVELLNRFDGIILFNNISRDIVARALHGIILNDINQNLLQKYSLRLELDPALADQIIEKGYSPDFGMRHLQRTVEDTVLKPLSRHIDELSETHAGKTVRVRWAEEAAVFDVEDGTAAS